MNVTVLTQAATGDGLGSILTIIAVAIVAIALFVANHNLKDRF